MSRTWVNGAPPFLNADNLNALEADVTTALGVPDAALAGRVVAGATATALNATYAPASGSANYSGSAAGTVGKPLAATDPTTTNARTPTAHATTHGTGGSDPVTLDAAQVATGNLADARMPTTAQAVTLTATYGKVVKWSKYGTNAAALVSAASEAGVGGTVVAEKAAGPYTIDTAVTLTEVSLKSDGATINANALGAGVAALTFTSGGGSLPDMVVSGFQFKGPGVRSLGVKTANVDGIQITGSAMPKFRDLFVQQFDSGFVLNNSAGHLYWDHCNVTNNYYGIYGKFNTYDYFFKDCKINGNTFANFATSADQGFAGMVLRDCHVGFAPYGIYQEATPANQGKPKIFLQEVILDHTRFEQIGNAAIFTAAQQDGTNASITSNLRIIHPGFSWSPTSGNAGSYQLSGVDRNYAVVLSQTDRLLEIVTGAYPFTAGTLNAIRIKLAGHAALILEGGPSEAFVTQVVTDSGTPNVYAYARPAVSGTAETFTQLDISGSGYVRWNGTTVRYGGDTTSQYADIASNGVWRVRNSGGGYASAFDVTPTQATVPAGSTLRTGRAVTGSRPSAATVGAGSMFYDTSLSKPIYSDGTIWRDAAGTAV